MKKYIFILLFKFFPIFLFSFEMVDIPEITYIRSLENGIKQNVTVSSFYMAKDDITIEDWCKYKDASDTVNGKKISSSEEYLNMLKDDFGDCTIDEGYVDLDGWYTPEIDMRLPVYGISWIESVEYCNWLSKEENLDPCYEIIQNFDKTIFVKWNKNANGYRLPTVAEWEAVSEIYTSKFTEDYLFRTNISIYGNRNYKNRYESNSYGLVNLVCDVGKFLWDYYNENYENNFLKMINPTGPEKFEKPDECKFKDDVINELRVCTISCDIHTLKRFLNKSPFSFCETSPTMNINTIRLCRSKK